MIFFACYAGWFLQTVDDGRWSESSVIISAWVTFGLGLVSGAGAIVPSSDGTRFTSDATGHGMFVSIENVYSF